MDVFGFSLTNQRNATMGADDLVLQGVSDASAAMILTYLAKKNGHFNWLAPGKFECSFRHVIFKRILVIARWGISCEIAVMWMPLDLTDDQSSLVQVMAWCHQAISHYLNQCWPRSMPPYGFTRPQWVKGSNYLSIFPHHPPPHPLIPLQSLWLRIY